MTMQRPYYRYVTVEHKVKWWPIMNMLTKLTFMRIGPCIILIFE